MSLVEFDDDGDEQLRASFHGRSIDGVFARIDDGRRPPFFGKGERSITMATVSFDLGAVLKKISQREDARAIDLGCGESSLAHDLSVRGFRVIAIDREIPDDFESTDTLTGVEADLRTFEIEARAFDLAILKSVLPYFRADEKRALFRRAVDSLKPDGVILVEAFTVDDPSFRLLEKRGFNSDEHNTFVHPDSGDVVSFFDRGELRRWAEEDGLAILHYEEIAVPDGKSEHRLAFLCARSR